MKIVTMLMVLVATSSRSLVIVEIPRALKLMPSPNPLTETPVNWNVCELSRVRPSRSLSGCGRAERAFTAAWTSGAGWFEKRQAGERRQCLLAADAWRVMAHIGEKLHDKGRLSGHMIQAMPAMQRHLLIRRVGRKGSIAVHRDNRGGRRAGNGKITTSAMDQ